MSAGNLLRELGEECGESKDTATNESRGQHALSRVQRDSRHRLARGCLDRGNNGAWRHAPRGSEKGAQEECYNYVSWTIDIRTVAEPANPMNADDLTGEPLDPHAVNIVLES